jgi:hypothetical protein
VWNPTAPANPALGIDEVACLLGYQYTSSFYRAFNGWKGMPPIDGGRKIAEMQVINWPPHSAPLGISGLDTSRERRSNPMPVKTVST